MELNTADAVASETVQANAVVLNSRYAESIIGDRAAAYDGYEIHGVRNLNADMDPDVNGTNYEVDDENPDSWSVYVHLRAGGIDCVGDFGTQELAADYGRELAEKYGWAL